VDTGGNLRTALGNGQTQLVKKVPTGQGFVFFGLRVWSKRVCGSRARTHLFDHAEQTADPDLFQLEKHGRAEAICARLPNS
jgi:hypothetical protein